MHVEIAPRCGCRELKFENRKGIDLGESGKGIGSGGSVGKKKLTAGERIMADSKEAPKWAKI